MSKYKYYLLTINTMFNYKQDVVHLILQRKITYNHLKIRA